MSFGHFLKRLSSEVDTRAADDADEADEAGEAGFFVRPGRLLDTVVSNAKAGGGNLVADLTSRLDLSSRLGGLTRRASVDQPAAQPPHGPASAEAVGPARRSAVDVVQADPSPVTTTTTATVDTISHRLGRLTTQAEKEKEGEACCRPVRPPRGPNPNPFDEAAPRHQHQHQQQQQQQQPRRASDVRPASVQRPVKPPAPRLAPMLVRQATSPAAGPHHNAGAPLRPPPPPPQPIGGSLDLGHMFPADREEALRAELFASRRQPSTSTNANANANANVDANVVAEPIDLARLAPVISRAEVEEDIQRLTSLQCREIVSAVDTMIAVDIEEAGLFCLPGRRPGSRGSATPQGNVETAAAAELGRRAENNNNNNEDDGGDDEEEKNEEGESSASEYGESGARPVYAAEGWLEEAENEQIGHSLGKPEEEKAHESEAAVERGPEAEERGNFVAAFLADLLAGSLKLWTESVSAGVCEEEPEQKCALGPEGGRLKSHFGVEFASISGERVCDEGTRVGRSDQNVPSDSSRQPRTRLTSQVNSLTHPCMLSLYPKTMHFGKV
ncbi:unnamed protein product [Protopolystoma xenopodis]|uniref:Uncharacterized protein n=1 Tax=Protopolystoma xenopodis TaxID=117903 RepID=A0A448WIA7_9PLAT|nr:unnamed protein product [Protopolystoma xenopodis]